MSGLAVKRLDSPLVRSAPKANRSGVSEPAPVSQQSFVGRRPDVTSRAHPPRPPAAAEPGEAPTSWKAQLDELPPPPRLDEPLEMLSSRLPTSLRRVLAQFTVALRDRNGGRVSQKQLPEQELLAVLIWLAGSPQDPQTVNRLAMALDLFRARRFAAAAAALDEGSAPGDMPGLVGA